MCVQLGVTCELSLLLVLEFFSWFSFTSFSGFPSFAKLNTPNSNSTWIEDLYANQLRRIGDLSLNIVICFSFI